MTQSIFDKTVGHTLTVIQCNSEGMDLITYVEFLRKIVEVLQEKQTAAIKEIHLYNSKS